METSSQVSLDTTSQRPESEPELVEAHEDEKPTASHELAEMAMSDDHEGDKGIAQIEHGDVEVRNLGWNEKPDAVAQTLVGGLSNEDLWALVRRFNKQVFCVRSIEEPPVGCIGTSRCFPLGR
jgi:hypothetical protein